MNKCGIWKRYASIVGLCGPMLMACDVSPPPVPEVQQQAQQVEQEKNQPRSGDLDAITESGEIRILYHGGAFLPRRPTPHMQEREALISFAGDQHLVVEMVPVDQFEDLVPALLQGYGDIIAANFNVTDDRKTRVSFTVPTSQSVALLVGQKNPPPEAAANPAVPTLSVQKGTSFWPLAETLDLTGEYQLEELDGSLASADIAEHIDSGRLRFSILDSNDFEVAAQYLDNIEAVKKLSDHRPIAWAVRPENPKLLAALNKWIINHQLRRPLNEDSLGDLDEIKSRGELRVSLRNDLASYFIWRGELMGFEYELLHKFAEREKLRLSVVVANNHKELIDNVIEGKADIAAGFLVATEARKAMDIAFSRPYHYAHEVVVGSVGKEMESTQELAGKTLHLRRSSSYWQTAQDLIDQGIDIELVEVEEQYNTTDIIGFVGSGEFEYTIADGHLLQLTKTWRDDIDALLVLGEEQSHSWIVRKNNSQLLAAINRFHKKQYRGLFYNVQYERYFKSHRQITRHNKERFINGNTLSPYDDIVKPIAENAQIDWRLIVAQMYQESRFNPNARSWVGARGLMQVMPRTAKELGYTRLEDPAIGIRAGIEYLQWTQDRFEESLPPAERLWFALAAYNAGPGHVRDARRLAEQQGWNPNKWFGNVEKAMLLLSKRKYHRKSRFGYVRGQEPVNYVREIRERYIAYLPAE